MKHQFITIALFIIPSIIYGLQFKMSNLNGQFHDNAGDAKIDELIFHSDQIGHKGKAIQFSLQKEENRYQIEFSGQSIIFKEIPAPLLAIEGFLAESFNLLWEDQGRFETSFNYFELQTKSNNYQFPHFNLSCHGDSSLPLEKCIKKGHLIIDEIDLKNNLSGEWRNVFSQLGLGQNIGIEGIDQVKDIRFQITNHQFYGTFKFKKIIPLKVKTWGSINHDIHNKTIDIHLRKAKASFLSVKKTILKELRNSSTGLIKVRGDHIFIHY